MKEPWSSESTRRLRHLCDKGLTLSAAAFVLRRSRNSICGKAYGLGLTFYGGGRRHKLTPETRAKISASRKRFAMNKNMERFSIINEIRLVCDQQGMTYSGDSWTRENIAWIFEKAKLQIIGREIYCWRCHRELADEFFYYCFDCGQECWAYWGA